MVIENKREFIFHPFLLSLYPVVALLAHNMGEMNPVYALRPLVFSLLCGVLVYFMLTRFLSVQRAAVLFFWLGVLFFSYGHVYQLIERVTIGGVVIGQHRVLAPFWIILLCAGSWFILKRTGDLATLNRLLNLVSVVLFVVPLFQVTKFEIDRAHAQSNRQIETAYRDDVEWLPKDGQLQSEALPDVYYIILDAYMRDDMLRKFYGLDVSPFIDRLSEMGFYVALCSQSNYAHTSLSIPSVLNMNYLQEVAPELMRNNMSWAHMGDYAKRSLVLQLFKQLGYRIVVFDTGNDLDRMENADVVISRATSPWVLLLDFRQVGEFEILFLRTTALRLVVELQPYVLPDWNVVRTPEQNHYQTILYGLDELAKVPELTGPKFVYWHLIAPHPPFVFAEDGSYLLTGEADPGYINEIKYLNVRILELMQTIIRESRTPPVIILQADHGLDTENRMAIFSAYYLPGNHGKWLYPEITPVNTFRVVFNELFDAGYPLLKDVSYFSEHDTPYNFTEVRYPCETVR